MSYMYSDITKELKTAATLKKELSTKSKVVLYMANYSLGSMHYTAGTVVKLFETYMVVNKPKHRAESQ